MKNRFEDLLSISLEDSKKSKKRLEIINKYLSNLKKEEEYVELYKIQNNEEYRFICSLDQNERAEFESILTNAFGHVYYPGFYTNHPFYVSSISSGNCDFKDDLYFKLKKDFLLKQETRKKSIKYRAKKIRDSFYSKK